MKTLSLATAAVALCLSSCNKPWAADAGDGGSAHGRFFGVGIYPVDRMWSQIGGLEASKSPTASHLKDDHEVIVVVDTRTGELRQCGNMSGFCVGMNPWSRPLTQAQSMPLGVLKH